MNNSTPLPILRRPWLAPLLAAAVVAIVGLWLSATLNIWVDEAYSMHTTGRGIGYALQEATAFELQPPLYFLLLAAWRVANEASVVFARLPSIAFAAGGAAVIVVTLKRLAPRIPPTILALAVALNPIVLWSAAEMRVYSLVLLFTAALTLFFLEGFLAEKPSRVAQLLYVLAAIGGLYTQFYVSFILLAFGAALVVSRRSLPVAFIIANVGIALGFLPFVRIALRDLQASEGGDVRHISFLMALHEVLNANFVYVLPHEIAWSGAVKLCGFFLAIVLAGALIFVGRPRLSKDGVSIALVWLLACLILSSVFALTGEALDVRRHAIAIAPLALVSALALMSALRNRRRSLLIASALVYTTFTVGSLWWLYRPPASKTGDWQHVASLVKEKQSFATIVIFPSNLALPLARYLPESARVVPMPRAMPFVARYLATMKLYNEAEVANTFKRNGVIAPFWIITDNSCDPGPQPYDFACHYLESFLRKHYARNSRYVFHGAVATLYGPVSRVARAGLP